MTEGKKYFWIAFSHRCAGITSVWDTVTDAFVKRGTSTGEGLGSTMSNQIKTRLLFYVAVQAVRKHISV